MTRRSIGFTFLMLSIPMLGLAFVPPVGSMFAPMAFIFFIYGVIALRPERD